MTPVIDAVSVIADKTRRPRTDRRADHLDHRPVHPCRWRRRRADVGAVDGNLPAGMTDREIVTWTRSMIDSGTRMDFGGLRRAGRLVATVDKHSTGGVGDKITLPLRRSSRRSGWPYRNRPGADSGTPGNPRQTESISGWRADLTTAQMHSQLESVGAVICAAGADLAPADRKMYRAA